MVSLTLSVSEELRTEMELFPEINWSVIAREAIIKRIMLLKKIREFSKNSELTEEDTLRIGREVNKGIAKKHLKK